MSFLFGRRKRSESDDSPVAFSKNEQETVALADALLDAQKADAALAELVRRGKGAARVLALLLAGRVMQSKWWYWANSGDDLSLDPLWKLEEALVAIGPDAAPFVRPLLHHPRWTTQFMAINTLGDLKDRESLDDIIKLLERPSGRMTMAAAKAIGKIGDLTAIPYLEKALAKATGWDQDCITRAIKDLRTKR